MILLVFGTRERRVNPIACYVQCLCACACLPTSLVAIAFEQFSSLPDKYQQTDFSSHSFLIVFGISGAFGFLPPSLSLSLPPFLASSFPSCLHPSPPSFSTSPLLPSLPLPSIELTEAHTMENIFPHDE